MREHMFCRLLTVTLMAHLVEAGVAQESPGVDRELIGTIVNREGQPVAGATLFTHAMGALEQNACQTTSNGQGEFKILFPREWPDDVNMHTWILTDEYAVKIVRPGVILDDNLGDRNVTITLDRPDPAVFQVLGPDGNVVPDVPVRLESMNAPLREFAIDGPSNYSMYVPPELKERFTRTTNSEGKVTLEFVSKSLVHRVAVMSPEYGDQQISFNSRQGDILKLQPVGELTVQVDDEFAADFAGIQLSIDTGNLATYTSKQDVTLNEAGQAHLPKVMTGWVRCDLPEKEINGRFLVAAEEVEVKAGESHVFHLKPVKSLPVVGSVLTKDTNEPISGARVYLSSSSRHSFGKSAETDSNGEFTILVAPGIYRLWCTLDRADAAIRDRYYFDSSGALFRQRTIRIPAGEKEHVVPPILATPKFRVRGQVRNLDSQPIANATVMLFPSRGTRPILTIQTDASGHFEVEAKEKDVTSSANRWVVVEKDGSTNGYREVMPLYARDDDPNSLVLVQAEWQ
ncbi:MAG: hypothetical protein JW829_18090 [Pirellulales bacterium]|nr:hypothetical protein [Pirellulales bacterium]